MKNKNRENLFLTIKSLITLSILWTQLALAQSQLPPCPESGDFNNCRGERVYDSGAKYIGDFVGNKRGGKGIMFFANGDKYEGDFKDSLLSGQGQFTWKDGEIYIGQYKEGRREGSGTFKYSSGNSYVGEWRNNVKHGRGVNISAAGIKTHDGTWNDGIFVSGNHVFVNKPHVVLFGCENLGQLSQSWVTSLLKMSANNPQAYSRAILDPRSFGAQCRPISGNREIPSSLLNENNATIIFHQEEKDYIYFKAENGTVFGLMVNVNY